MTPPHPHLLHRTQIVGGSLREVFAFFKSPHNLEAITPPWLNFRVVSASDAEMRAGTRIAYRLRLYGLPFRWESRIAEYVEDRMFADEQITGPYAHWCHRHLFAQVAGGVRVDDIVEYRLPFGPLGTLVHAAVVRRQLRQIFDHRAKVMAARFPQP